jgi:DNA-binding Lrp family transcriptional regulator
MWIKNLDEVDNEIIDILVKNARTSYSDVAKAVGLSRTAVKSRIDELERKGVITGYHAVVSPQKTTETVTL